MKMWIRKRLDIYAKDLIHGIFYCFSGGSRTSIIRKIQRLDEKIDRESLICLSVRTGFDLLFKSLKLEPGAEVLMSALTIPDMPKIIQHHGLVPIAIDLEIGNLAPSLAKIEAAITPKTKAIVVAHLFGGIVDLEEISKIAVKHDLLLIEDCAQAFYSHEYKGHPNADVSMFSFGTIKTATALGGGILIVRKNPLLFDQIQRLYNTFPLQGRTDFLIKILKYLAINFLSLPRIFPLVIKWCKRKGIDYDPYIHTLSRSFPHGDLFEKIRRQPSLPLLKLLLYRLKTYDFKTIETRISKGKYLLENLPASVQFPGQKASFQSFWAFPVLCSNPLDMILLLREQGFDATSKNSLIPVGLKENEINESLVNVTVLQNKLVFLPLYAEIPMVELKKMVQCLKNFKTSDIPSLHPHEMAL